MNPAVVGILAEVSDAHKRGNFLRVAHRAPGLEEVQRAAFAHTPPPPGHLMPRRARRPPMNFIAPCSPRSEPAIADLLLRISALIARAFLPLDPLCC